MSHSFSTESTLSVNGKEYRYYSLPKLGEQYDISRLPFSLKILLENLLRHEDGENITKDDIEALANWDAKATPQQEIAFTPARANMACTGCCLSNWWYCLNSTLPTHRLAPDI